MESIVIIGASPQSKLAMQARINELAPSISVTFSASIPVQFDSVDLVISLTRSVVDYLELARVLELQQIPLIQAKYQTFDANNDSEDDLWHSPIMDAQHKIVLIEFPVDVLSLFDEVKRELSLEKVCELDDKSIFNTVTPDDVARVLSSVAVQTLAGAKNLGYFQYTTGGKLTWYRLCVFLGESSDYGAENLMAGAGLGVDRSLDGERLKHAYGIKPRGWRVDVAALWKSYLSA